MKYSSLPYKIWMRFLTWIGDIMMATEPPKVKGRHIRRLLMEAMPGDVIFRKYNYYLDSFFIKGKYTHSGCVVDDISLEDKPYGLHVAHALAEGCVADDLIDFVKDCDGFMLYRPPYIPYADEGYDQITAFENVARGHVNFKTPYDGLFDKRNSQAVYCHELTAKALEAAGFSVKAGKIIYAEDILKSVPGEIILECP